MKNAKFIACAMMFVLSTSPATSMSISSPSSEAVGTSIRTIAKVETVQVDCPVGTVPRLPYQLWVTYSDGKSEYRQIRWSNSALATEQEQADPVKNPVGHEYTVKGFIVGDDTTLNGYPIIANVTVVDGAYATPSHIPAARPLPLNKVVINGDNRLTSNRDLAIHEILHWDVSQQLYNYRDTYGLSTEGYTEADGWDSPTTKLKGHGSGHYMSALAFAFASATQADQKDKLRTNIRRMVDELRQCQERTFVWNKELGRYWEARDFAPEAELRAMKGSWADFDVYKTQYEQYGYGYLNAIPAQHAALIEMYRDYNNTNWVWAPYYSIHKQLAGLIDIATYVDDREIAAKALLIAKDMGLWIWNRLHYRTFVKTDGTQEERRAQPGNRYEMWNIYIAGEDGGTGESLARLSEMVSDPAEKAHLLEASNFFDSPAFYHPLARNIDDIRTRHANQHIPKIISALWSFRGNNDPYYFNLAENFWEMIQGRYRYSTGGVGNGEMFRQPYTQILSMANNVSSDRHRNLYPAPSINETCCAYNLAKLTKDLNTFHPDDAQYMDYYERVLYNQLVGSINHTCYEMTYHYAVGLNATKGFGSNTPQSTCCGGTGSENHVKYQEATYFVSDNTLWVALYMPTTLTWDDKNVTLRQDCLWPAESSTLKLTQGTADFVLKLRVPYWATEGFDVKLNGTSIASAYQPGSYITIPARTWTTADAVEITMPFSKHIDFGPDKLETAATGKNQTNVQFPPMWVGTLMYGPLAMTATDITSWEQATVNVDSDLENIRLNGPSGSKTGMEGNLYTLTIGDKTLQPDYFRHEKTTHYLRIHWVGDPNAALRASLWTKLQEAKIFKAENYTKASYNALSKVMAEGDKLYQSAGITQKQVEKQIAAQEKAIGKLAATGLNKTVLEATIQTAESHAAERYTWDTYATLRQELAKAKEIYETGKDQKQVDVQQYKLDNALADLVSLGSIEKNLLHELLYIAGGRKMAQERWNGLAVKVPEFSPWAPHGYTRLMEQMAAAQKVLDNKDKNYNQTEVNEATSVLNAAINTMRPGNLAELEDLGGLLSLLTDARALNSPALAGAIEYAEMIVAYVGDGSGTLDMIENASARLSAALEKTAEL